MLLLSSLLLAILPAVYAFDFNVESSTLTECGYMDLIWRGGTPPYTLTIIVSYLSTVVQADS
jgi:hypothetical protein